MTQPEQLALIPPVRPAAVRRPSTAAPTGRPKYGHHKTVRRCQCDDCVVAMHEAHGKGPAIRSAKWKRSAFGGDLLLCDDHAKLRHEADGLGKLKGVA